MNKKEYLESKLIVGTKIKIGENYAKDYGFTVGEVIELIEGSFERYNGLYDETEKCPAIWVEDDKDFSSIYHLFGNDLDDFMDCEIII